MQGACEARQGVVKVCSALRCGTSSRIHDVTRGAMPDPVQLVINEECCELCLRPYLAQLYHGSPGPVIPRFSSWSTISHHSIKPYPIDRIAALTIVVKYRIS